MTTKIFLISVVVSFVLFSSCESNTPDNRTETDPKKTELTGEETVMVTDEKHFAVKFFETVYESDKNADNIVISPFGMNMALGVLRNGAEGETKRVMQEVMGMKDFTDSEINAYFKELSDYLMAPNPFFTDPSVELAIANSIWYNKDTYVIKPDFADLSKTWFDASITGLDYSSMEKAVKIVNQWCEDHTNGLIKGMLEDLTDIEILNALYFKGNWSAGCEFDVSKTTKQDFTKEDGSRIPVDLMHNELYLTYYEDDYLSMTNIPYGFIGAYKMYFVLPNEGVAFGDMVGQLAKPGYWEQCLANTRPGKVDIYIPKFKLEYKIGELKEVLVQMGMGIACDASTAEFPHIANTNYAIGRATQKTLIRVDEKGTESAAITEFGATGSTGADHEYPFHTFRADRTFLFVIQENSTGTILFMGKAGNPAEE